MDTLHILVVDDNHINRLFFESALKKLSCTVTCADNGYAAIELAKSQPFDLILMDIRMDGIDGIETARQIKLRQKNRTTPVIAVSAETFDVAKHSAFSASLLKPVNQQRLAQILTEYTQNSAVFNHQKALEISHNDEDIVLHLRGLFIEQLNELKVKIGVLYQQQELEQLHNTLHQLLGSAKICAAENITTQIIKFKKQLMDGDSEQQQSFQKLIQAIEQAQKIVTE